MNKGAGSRARATLSGVKRASTARSESAPTLPGLFAPLRPVSPAAAERSEPARQVEPSVRTPTARERVPGLARNVPLPHVCGAAEADAHAHGLTLLIGVDEAGRGPLAGPVVVAACALPWPCPIAGIDDSKKLSEEAREALFEPILEAALGVGLVVVEHDVIDTLNILHASLHGMALAWEQLVERHPELRHAVLLVDGKDRCPVPDDVDQCPLVKGDARSVNIAAASILAKVARDRIMREAHLSWPVYGFDQHKGYPTAAHRAAVAEHGPCPIHRRSFTLPGVAAPPDDEAATPAETPPRRRRSRAASDAP